MLPHLLLLLIKKRSSVKITNFNTASVKVLHVFECVSGEHDGFIPLSVSTKHFLKIRLYLPASFDALRLPYYSYFLLGNFVSISNLLHPGSQEAL